MTVMQGVAAKVKCFRRSRAAPALAIVLACTLGPGGCAVGPDFARPAPPAASRYTRDTLHAEEDASKSDTVQHIALGREIEGNWWTFSIPRPSIKLLQR